MDILVMSRKEIEEFAKKEFKPKTALISITDYDWTFVDDKYCPNKLVFRKVLMALGE